jgi:hypothetical protein
MIPDNILKCMSADDRARLGKAGVTADEAQRKYADGEEKELQKHVGQLLTQRGVTCFLNPPMHKRSQLPEGWPDFTFCWQGRACAVECKTEKGIVKQEQWETLDTMNLEGWRVAVVRSMNGMKHFLDDAI